jgi:hypothetical protein
MDSRFRGNDVYTAGPDVGVSRDRVLALLGLR